MCMDRGKASKILYLNDGIIDNYSDFSYHGGLDEDGSIGSHIWMVCHQFVELFGKD